MIWTISWQAGTGGEQNAGELAEQAGVPLVDRQLSEAIALRLGLSSPGLAEELERQPPGLLLKVGLTTALAFGRGEATRELQLLSSLRESIEQVIVEAARRPCVILGHGAFVILADHPGAVHVRIRAPLAWRIERYAREQLIDRHRAEQEVRRDDRIRTAHLRRLYGKAIDDPSNFDLVCDASRFPPERLVELLLDAGGHRAEVLAHV